MMFKILSISHGWFDAGWFDANFNKQFLLTCSDFLCCDTPAVFLDAICNLLENKEEEEWICWQDEPGAYIMKLYTGENRLFIEIYDTNKDSHDLPHTGAALGKHITACKYKYSDTIETVANNILNEFELYENGNGLERYTNHWMEFPQQNYNRLKKFVEKLGAVC